MIGYRQISAGEFYAAGGFSNPHQCRVTRGGGWAYYREVR